MKNHEYCSHFFFRLIRYLYPTDDELKTLARVPKDKPKGKKDYKGKNTENGKTGPETFHIPRNLDLEVSITCTVLTVYRFKYVQLCFVTSPYGLGEGR